MKIENLLNVLLIGNGGREHALAMAIKSSSLCNKLYGNAQNPGIKELTEQYELTSNNSEKVIDFCKNNNIDLVVIGPEQPLNDGLANDLINANIKVFGPKKEAAQLESSKYFTKVICEKLNIPTAKYAHFNSADKAKEYLKTVGFPIVLKRNELFAGKGVTIAANLIEATEFVEQWFNSSDKTSLIIEEYLNGKEMSFFAICNGDTALPLATAQDYKRVGNNDTGPNTGGMGAISPSPLQSNKLDKQIMEKIIQPVIKHLSAEGNPFCGILYAGLMIQNNTAYLIEFNVRFGDPEAQVIIPRLKSDLLQLMYIAASNQLSKSHLPELYDHYCSTVVLCSNGYPKAYNTGIPIHIDAIVEKQTKIFQAGTILKNNILHTNGGRVLNITSSGKSSKEATNKCYKVINKINFKGMIYRNDIGS